MSMANFFNRLTNEVQIQNLDATNLQINNVPFNGGGGGGGGGGGISSVTSSDSSVTVTSQNGGLTMNLTNAGKNWSSFNATSDINMSSHNITGINSLSIDDNALSLYYDSNALGISISGGASGNVYDSYYNKPTLSDVLSVNSGNGLGYNITNVGSVGCSNLTVSNPTGVISVVNTASSTTGQVYSTFYPPPQMVTQSYVQQIVNTTQFTCPSYVLGGDAYFKFYTFNLANYPNCTNFTVNVTNISMNLINPPTSTGSISAQLYLVDNLMLNTISNNDLAKSKLPYALNASYLNGSASVINYGTSFQLQYGNTVNQPPTTLGIVFQCNNLDGGYFIRTDFECSITANTEYINWLAGTS